MIVFGSVVLSMLVNYIGAIKCAVKDEMVCCVIRKRSIISIELCQQIC